MPRPPFDAIFPKLPDDGRILYFARDRAEFEFLSHFYPARIVLDGEDWPSVEHYYQAQKSDSHRYRAAIRAAVSPGIAKRLAAPPDAPRRLSQQSWFRKNGKLPRADWAEVKLAVMRRADEAKFLQNPDLAQRLLATGDAELVEDSRNEAFWGTGRDDAGLNWAGRILMEIREKLRG
jgi:ribA/ribD-fused uncharacterized protein